MFIAVNDTWTPGFLPPASSQSIGKNHGLGTAPQRDRVVNMDASSTPSARLGICCKVGFGKEAVKQGD
jgi:hypothetical protein